MPKVETLRSLFVNGNVSIDPWSENGVAAEYRAMWPEEFAIAARFHAKDDPKLPGMFAGGKQNFPTATASGIDPEMLAQVPYRVRHAIAGEPSQARAYAMLEKHADDPFAEIDHDGLREAVARITQWANVPTEALTEAETAGLYERLYAPVKAEEARRGDRLAAYQAGQTQYAR